MARRPHSGFNILLTCAGRRVELLHALRRALDALGLTGNIVVSDIDPLAPTIQVADSFYMVPRLDSPGYVPAIVDICRRESIDLVLPLIDPDIPVLSRGRGTIESTGARLAVVHPEAADITGDKWLTSAFFQRLDLPTPRTWLPDQIDPRSVEYPLFIKPRRGSASKYTFPVRNATELLFFTGYVPDPIVQEQLPGPEITTDVVCDLDGRVLQVVSRRRIEVRWGEVVKGVTIWDQEITEACVKIARELPAVGPITVQCMMKDGVAHFTEVNARLGGGFPLAVAAEADPLRWFLARAADLPVEMPPLGGYRTGLYMTRFDASFFITSEDHKRIAGSDI